MRNPFHTDATEPLQLVSGPNQSLGLGFAVLRPIVPLLALYRGFVLILAPEHEMSRQGIQLMRIGNASHADDAYTRPNFRSGFKESELPVLGLPTGTYIACEAFQRTGP